MNKRGLSSVVTTVLIILLSIVAILIIWGFAKGFIFDSSSSISSGEFTSRLEIPGKNVIVNETEINLNLERKSGGPEITKFKFVFTDDNKEIKVIEQESELNELENKKFSFDRSDWELSNLSKIEVYAYFISEDGKEKLTKLPVAVYTFSGSEKDKVESPQNPQCSNECSSGSKQCSGNGVQTCGNYDSDECLEWNSAVACESGKVCSSGECVTQCTDTCSSLNYQCGTQTICGQEVNCGTCSNGMNCNLGMCEFSAPTQQTVFLKFDTNGSYEDNSGNDFYATCSGVECPKWDAQGKVGGAYYFDGTNNFLTLSSNIKDDYFSNKNFTIGLWIKTPDFMRWNSFFTAYGGGSQSSLWLVLDYFGQIDMRYWNNGDLESGTYEVNQDEWTHLTFSYNYSGDISKIYKNGVLINQGNQGPVESGTLAITTLGSRYDDSTKFMGWIDEFMIYNRTLTDQEVTQLYQSYS